MLKLFEYLVVGIGIIFLLITGGLVYWNWNQELKEKLLSGVFLGAVTVFVLVYAGLKEERIQRSFRVSVAVGDQTHLPIAVMDPEQSRVATRQLGFGRLSTPKVQEGGKEITLFQPPADFAATTRFCLDLLQYVTLKEILETQQEVVLLTSVSHGEVSMEDGVYRPYRPTKVAPVRTVDFPTRFASNRWFDHPSERFEWQNFKFLLPRETQIEIGYKPAAEGAGPERTTVTLKKFGFFELVYSIGPLGSTNGVVPAGLKLEVEERSHVSTHTFLVTLNARFEKYRSRHWEMDEYKKWADWTYEELKKKLGDAG